MVGIQTTTNPGSTVYVGCGSTTFSTITPTINPTPAGPPSCFPSHSGDGTKGITDADKVVKIISPNVASYCNGTNANWEQEGGGDPTTPAGNNLISSGYTLGSNVPDDCQHFYKGDLNQLQVNLCALPLEAIIDGCPYNGGQIDTVCGTFWLQSCTLEQKCAVGDPH